MRRILIVGIGCVTVKYLPKALRACGYEPVFLLRRDELSETSRAALETCLVHELDDNGREPDVLRFLEANPRVMRDVDAVTSLFDELFPLVCRIGDTFGVRRPEPSFAALASKSEVSRLVPEFCPQEVAFSLASLPTLDRAELPSSPHGFILKPTLSSGALGVVHMSLADGEPHAAIRAAMLASGVPGSAQQKWILQEKVEGRLISLEGYAQDGNVSFAGFSLRARSGATEVGNRFPASDHLPAAVRERSEACVTTLVERSGFRNGYFHCEFLATADTAYLIDANMGRPGGAAVIEQMALANGIEPETLLGHAVLLPIDAAAAGEPPAYRPLGHAQRTSSVWYGLERGGVVRSVSIPQDLTCRHTQIARNGATVPAVGVSDYAWVGMLTGLPDAVEREIDRIAILTANGTAGPFYGPASVM